MKKNFLFAVILIISANLLSCKKEAAVNNPEVTGASTIAQKNAAVSKRNMLVPFKGNIMVTFQLLQGPPVINQIISGNGTATHLGNWTFSANVMINVTTPPPFRVTGTAMFTAANGDHFYSNVSGVSIPIGNDSIRSEITHTITGGTGRFQNASGTLTAIGQNGPKSGKVDFDGEISF
jgi:hypothetical protein